jgi:hypothetical protein
MIPAAIALLCWGSYLAEKGKFCMATPLDPSLYPASYRTSLLRGGIKLLVIMSLSAVGLFARTHVVERGIAPWLLVWLTLLLLILLVTFANVTFAKVTLYPDRIERVTWFGTKSMLRADVVKLERRRFLIVFTVALLNSKRGLFEGVQLPTGIETDAAWDAWMTVAEDGDAVPTRRDALNVGQRS